MRVMIDLGVLPGFVAVILLFLAPPGPDMAYMVAAGLEGGRRSALKAILGIGTGMSLYAAAVAAGVGAVARSNVLLLDMVKIFGAAYLSWLAYTTIRHARRPGGEVDHGLAGRPYLRGLMVSGTNPKIMLFFLAVLPHFMGDAKDIRAQLAMLGAVNVVAEVALYGGIGVLAGTFNARFSRRRRPGVVLSFFASVVYLALAAAIAAELLL